LIYYDNDGIRVVAKSSIAQYCIGPSLNVI